MIGIRLLKNMKISFIHWLIKMKISVIIPTYNEEHVIKKCLDSLVKQTYKSFEIIVVDDGSTDNTLDVLSKYKKCQLLKQNHTGPGEARNLGAKKAKGEILVFVDADMTFDKNFLSKLVEPIKKKVTKGTFSKEEYVSNWENIWARCWNINEGWEKKRRHPKNYPDIQKVFRALLKKEFERVGGFDRGGHYTDDYLSEKLGYEATNAPGAIFYHDNPENLKEVFVQARWSSKREYKLGNVGVLYSLFRSFFFVSIVIGVVKSLKKRTPQFVIFKVVYDWGTFLGLLEILFATRQGK